MPPGPVSCSPCSPQFPWCSARIRQPISCPKTANQLELVQLDSNRPPFSAATTRTTGLTHMFNLAPSSARPVPRRIRARWIVVHPSSVIHVRGLIPAASFLRTWLALVLPAPSRMVGYLAVEGGVNEPRVVIAFGRCDRAGLRFSNAYETRAGCRLTAAESFVSLSPSGAVKLVVPVSSGVGATWHSRDGSCSIAC